MKKFDIDEVRRFIKESSETSKIYIGSDSERFKKKDSWFAHYTTVVVIHLNGNAGCKVFGETITEIDFDQKKNKPFNRMMREVYLAADMYLALEEAIGDRYSEVHLDLNVDPVHGSNCAVQSAIGYIKGTCGLIPKLKPNSTAASICADRFSYLL